MYPGLRSAAAHCEVSALEERLLRSPEAPIVLLKRNGRDDLARQHRAAQSPAGDHAALHAVAPLADARYRRADRGHQRQSRGRANLHRRATGAAPSGGNRPTGFWSTTGRYAATWTIPSCASCQGRELVLRRARGYAPLPVHLDAAVPSILAVGPHLKNTVALSLEREVFVSQHIGDLRTAGGRHRVPSGGRRPAGALRGHTRPSSPATPIPTIGRPATPTARSDRSYRSSTTTPTYSPAWLRTAWPHAVLGVAWGRDRIRPGWNGLGRRVPAHHPGFLRARGAPSNVPPSRRRGGRPGTSSNGARAALRAVRRGAVRPPGPHTALRVSAGGDRRALRTALVRRLNAPRTSSMGRLFDGVSAIPRAAPPLRFRRAGGHGPGVRRTGRGGRRLRVRARRRIRDLGLHRGRLGTRNPAGAGGSARRPVRLRRRGQVPQRTGPARRSGGPPPRGRGGSCSPAAAFRMPACCERRWRACGMRPSGPTGISASPPTTAASPWVRSWPAPVRLRHAPMQSRGTARLGDRHVPCHSG